MRHVQDGHEPHISVLLSVPERIDRGVDEDVHDFVDRVGAAFALHLVEHRAAALVDHLGAVGDNLADQRLLAAEVIAHRAVIALAGGLCDLAHGDAIDAPLGIKAQGNALDVRG